MSRNITQYTPVLVSSIVGVIFGWLLNSYVNSYNFEDDEDAPDNAYSDSNEECKLVLVVRTDLGMSPGKIAAQCGHAAVACYESIERSNPAVLRRWRNGGQAKIVLQCPDENELVALKSLASHYNITSRIIHDAGRTEIAVGSATVLGVGPAPKSAVDKVTGHLRLYR